MRQWWYGAARDATAVEPNQLTKNAVVNRPRLAVARERIPGMARKKKAESSAPPRESSSTSNRPSAAASESSFSTGESSSSSESEKVVARQTSVARKKTFATAREKMAPDEPAESAVVPDQIAKSAKGAEQDVRAVKEDEVVKASPPSLHITEKVAGRGLDSLRQGLPTIFMYQGETREAYVAGTFYHWEHISIVKSQKDFVALVDLTLGKHQFKYIVDDEWTHYTGLPTVSNQVGSQNNVITIQQEDFETFAALNMARILRSTAKLLEGGTRAGHRQDAPPHGRNQLTHPSLINTLPLLLQDHHHGSAGAAGGHGVYHQGAGGGTQDRKEPRS